MKIDTGSYGDPKFTIPVGLVCLKCGDTKHFGNAELLIDAIAKTQTCTTLSQFV